GRGNALPGLGDRMDGAGNRLSNSERRSVLQAQMLQARQNPGDNRNDRQQNRQDRQNDRREDWQDFKHDHFGHHDHWHHGNWHGNFGDWWDHMWDDHTAAMVLGVTSWGVNRLGNWFGYGSYSNPYYDSGGGGGGGGGYSDYSEPVTMDA